MLVIIILTSLAALIIFLLCVPLDLGLQVDMSGRPKFSLQFSWLFGLVRREVTRGKKKPEEKRRVPEGKPKAGGKKKTYSFLFNILRTRGLLRQIQSLLRDVLSSFKIRISGDFRVGLGNPAATGFLFAAIGPVMPFLGSSRFHQISIRPSFGDEAVCEGYSHGAVRLQPIRLIAPFLKFALSPAAIRVIKRMALTKWKNRK